LIQPHFLYFKPAYANQLQQQEHLPVYKYFFPEGVLLKSIFSEPGKRNTNFSTVYFTCQIEFQPDSQSPADITDALIGRLQRWDFVFQLREYGFHYFN